MVDHRSDEAERALHHREHVAWLRGQQADLTEHRRSHEASMRDEEDYAVGSEQSSLRFEGEHSFSIIDDETDGVRYRSLAMPPSFASTEPSQEVTGTEELVYRSIPVLGRQQSDSSTTSSADADASWLAAGRPPLLQRHRAFNRGRDLDGPLLGL